MKKKFNLIALLLISITGFSQNVVENFNYGTNYDTLSRSTIGGANWKRHSGGGTSTNNLMYNTSSLTYTGYSSNNVGGSAEIWSTLRSEDVNRDLTTAFTSGSVYASFLLKVDSVAAASTVGDYFMHYCDTSTVTGANTLSNLRGRIFIRAGSTANTYQIGLNKGGAGATAVFTTTNYAYTSTLLIVLKYTFDISSTSNDSVFAHIFTSGIPSTEPSTPTLAATDVTSVSDFVRLRSICLRQGSAATYRARVDGIRVSNSWATSALPVKLTSFKAEIINKQTNLNWTTASETNNKGFEVQKSVDGVNFETVGFVKGVGNSNKIVNYNFVDNNNLSAFYRLNQIDFDGMSELSKVVSVKNNEELILQITPNPFVNSIEVVTNKNIVSAEIIDITGKTKVLEVINGTNATIDTHNLSNGVYFIRVNNGETIITKRIIKN